MLCISRNSILLITAIESPTLDNAVTNNIRHNNLNQEPKNTTLNALKNILPPPIIIKGINNCADILNYLKKMYY